MEQRVASVIRLSDGVLPPEPTVGMERRQLVDRGETWIGRVTTEAGRSSGWHYHGNRDTYIHVLSGRIRIDFGPGGAQHVEGGPGDTIINPAGLVHRETTVGESAEALVVRIGDGPENVNVDGPEPG